MSDTLKAFEEYRVKTSDGDQDRRMTFGSFDYNLYEEFVEYMMYEHIQRRRKQVVKSRSQSYVFAGQ